MIRINLIPRDILAKEEQKQQTTQAIAAGAVIVIVLAAVSFGHWYKLNSLEKKLVAEKQEYDKLQKIVEQVQALEATAAAVRTRLGVVTDLLKGRPLYPYFMVDFVKTMPTGVFLTTLGTKNLPNNQLAVNAAASASTPETIADWMRSLVNSGRFSDPGLSAISVTGPELNRTHMFTIQTNYKNPSL